MGGGGADSMYPGLVSNTVFIEVLSTQLFMNEYSALDNLCGFLGTKKILVFGLVVSQQKLTS